MALLGLERGGKGLRELRLLRGDGDELFVEEAARAAPFEFCALRVELTRALDGRPEPPHTLVRISSRLEVREKHLFRFVHEHGRVLTHLGRGADLLRQA